MQEEIDQELKKSYIHNKCRQRELHLLFSKCFLNHSTWMYSFLFISLPGFTICLILADHSSV